MLIQHGTFSEQHIRASSREQLTTELRDLIETPYGPASSNRWDVVNPGVYFLRADRSLAYDCRESLSRVLANLICSTLLAPDIVPSEDVVANYIECLTPSLAQFEPHRDRVAHSLIAALESREVMPPRLSLLCLNGLCSIHATLDNVSMWFDLANLSDIYAVTTAVDGACYQNIHEGLRVAGERLTNQDQIRCLLESVLISYPQLLERHGTTAVTTGIWSLRKKIDPSQFNEFVSRIDELHQSGLANLLSMLNATEAANIGIGDQLISESELDERLKRFQHSGLPSCDNLTWLDDFHKIRYALRGIECDRMLPMRRGLRLLTRELHSLPDKSSTCSLIWFLLRKNSPLHAGLPELVSDFLRFFRESVSSTRFETGELIAMTKSLLVEDDEQTLTRLVKGISTFDWITAVERLDILSDAFGANIKFAHSIPIQLLSDAIDADVMNDMNRFCNWPLPVISRLRQLNGHRKDRSSYQESILSIFDSDESAGASYV